MGLHVGLTYNLKTDAPICGGAEDWTAECEEAATVERIAAALTRLGHVVELFPFRKDLLERLTRQRPDVVFNIAEGWSGRNRESLVPAILEFLGIPYTGSDALSLGLALDKALCKRVVAAAGVPVPPTTLIENEYELAKADIALPAFVKPNTEGSSKGVRSHSRVATHEELEAQVRWVIRTYAQPALVEPFLGGREFTIGVLGNEPPVGLPIMEITPSPKMRSQPFVYSYETKCDNLEAMFCPAQLPEITAARLTQIALCAHQVLGCKDVSRVDIRMDDAGNPFFLEINPLPGLAEYSLLPIQAAAAGICFDELVGAILSAACRRHSLEQRWLARQAQ
jgi:D-alanine-D-alanine ligase